MAQQQAPTPDTKENDKPPFFKHWSGMYALVLGTLLALIALFYLITIHFS